MIFLWGILTYASGYYTLMLWFLMQEGREALEKTHVSEWQSYSEYRAVSRVTLLSGIGMVILGIACIVFGVLTLKNLILLIIK